MDLRFSQLSANALQTRIDFIAIKQWKRDSDLAWNSYREMKVAGPRMLNSADFKSIQEG